MDQQAINTHYPDHTPIAVLKINKGVMTLSQYSESRNKPFGHIYVPSGTFYHHGSLCSQKYLFIPGQSFPEDLKAGGLYEPSIFIYVSPATQLEAEKYLIEAYNRAMDAYCKYLLERVSVAKHHRHLITPETRPGQNAVGLSDPK